jgi:hypothetical protein
MKRIDKMNKILMLVVTMCLVPQAYAQQGSHGGIILKKGTACFLADFAEMGIETTAKISQNLVVAPETTNAIKMVFPDKSPNDPRNLKMARFRNQLALKLTEVAQSAPFLANILLDSMRFYTWSFIHFDPIPADDAHLTIVGAGNPFYIARRSNSWIQIDAQSFDCLHEKGEVGLIFHEMLSSLSRDQHSSDPIRPLVGFLFTDDVNRLDQNQLYHFVESAKINSVNFANPNSPYEITFRLLANLPIHSGSFGSYRQVSIAPDSFSFSYSYVGDADQWKCAFDMKGCDLSRICNELTEQQKPNKDGFYEMSMEMLGTEFSLNFLNNESLQITVNSAAFLDLAGTIDNHPRYTQSECVDDLTSWISESKAKYEQNNFATPLGARQPYFY